MFFVFNRAHQGSFYISVDFFTVYFIIFVELCTYGKRKQINENWLSLKTVSR